MRQCVRIGRKVFSQDAFKPFRGKEISPGKGSVNNIKKDHVPEPCQ